MKLRSKICGVSESKTLKFIVNHNHPAQFVGFIVNYPKSKRYVQFDKLKSLIKIDRKKTFFVAVLVKPSQEILEKIKFLKFDYYQIYDCTPKEIRFIKNRYKKKIITAITVKNRKDVAKYKLYNDVTDIFLFDSKGYDKSLSFNHKLVQNLDIQKDVMLAGNIQINDNFEKYCKMVDIIDISGGLETSGLKDNSKIEFFLKKINKINYEN